MREHKFPGASRVHSLIDSLLVFWVPFSANVYLRIILLFLLGALVLGGIVQGLKNSETREKSSSMNSAAQMFAAVFVIVFPLFLLAYNSLIVPGADVYGRVLSPVYVFGIILLISGIYKLSRFGKRRSIWWGFLILSFGLISVNAVRAVSVAIDRHDNGREFTSRAWAGSESVQYLRSLAESRTTYSNGIDAVYFLTRREALRIPAKIDRMTGKNNAEFDREIGAMRNDVLQNRAIVVYLDKITWRWYLPSKDELENVYHFPILVRLEDGVVYGSK